MEYFQNKQFIANKEIFLTKNNNIVKYTKTTTFTKFYSKKTKLSIVYNDFKCALESFFVTLNQNNTSFNENDDYCIGEMIVLK